MIRRALGAGAVVLALVAVAATAATAAAPQGPRLAFVKWSLRPERLELLGMSLDGDSPQRLIGGSTHAKPVPFPFVKPSWSPDGAQLAFTALQGSLGEEGPPPADLWIVKADGSGLHRLPSARRGLGPVFGPAGNTLAFARVRNIERYTRPVEVFYGATVWITDVIEGGAKRLTPWRNGLHLYPSSFAPDGSTLAMTRIDYRRGRDPEAVLLDIDTGRIDLLARKASGPVFSPDGTEVAFARHSRRRDRKELSGFTESSDIYVLRLADSTLRRLTATRHIAEQAPDWDPSGERLVYTEFRDSESTRAPFGAVSALGQINAEGTCSSHLLIGGGPGIGGAAWQPGPGREAGRIAC